MGGVRGAAASRATASSRPLERSSNSQDQRVHQAVAAVQLTLHARDCDVRPRPSTVQRHEKARCCLRSWRKAGGIADDPVRMRSLAKTSSRSPGRSNLVPSSASMLYITWPSLLFVM